jgi:protocatechuate 3,4-dioxygenase beta subunit
MARAAAVVLFSFAAATSLTALAQQARDTAPPPQATGRISGTVIGAESQRPVRFARVEIGSSVGASTAVTDDNGAFVFERLRPGAYMLHVSKPGYLDTQYGQARPGTNTPGRPIALKDKEQIDRLVVPLSQGGSISGVIRDDHGDPAYRANVQVSRWTFRNGFRILEPVESTVTDERGRFRVSLLPPRDYIVTAIPDDEAFPETKVPQLQLIGFAPAFYPGTVTARTAGVISLGLGEDRSDIDFQVPLVQMGSVTGTVLSTDGKPVTNVPVSLANREFGDFERGTETDGAGRFAFAQLVPGAYTVSVGKSSGGGHITLMSKNFRIDGNDFSLAVDGKRGGFEVTKALETRLRFMEAEIDPSGRVKGATLVGAASGEVNVTAAATSDIVLTMEPLRTVAGRITTEGASAPPVTRGTVVEIVAQSLAADRFETKVGADGMFVIPNVVPGRYHVNFAGEAPPWTLASAMSAGVDALDYLLEVPRDRDVRDLVLTLRDRSAQLSGTVTDASSKPATDRTVIVFPSDERLWTGGFRRIRADTLNADGKYSFDEMRPGMYLVALTDSVEWEQWLDPEFLRKLQAAAIPVTIGEGEKRVQDLRIR